MIGYVVVISMIVIVPSILMTSPLAQNNPGETQRELGYALVPPEVLQQIEERGPRAVCWELFNRVADWHYMTEQISWGHCEWIQVAARFYAASDAVPSELDHALWAALETAPDCVLEAGTFLRLERVCSEIVSTPLDCSFDDAVAGVERRLKALTTVTRAELGKKRKTCEALLREALPKIREEHVTALIRTAEFGGPEVVKFILAGGVFPNSRTRDGSTALMKAASKGRLENVKLLVGRGADVNEPGTAGWTPLMEASSQGHAETVKFLLERGAPIHVKADDGSRAVDIALARGRREVANILMRNGALNAPE